MKGIRARLVVWNVLAIGLILAGMAAALRFQLKANLLGQVDRELERDIADVSTVHREGAPIDMLLTKEVGGAKDLHNILVREEVRKSGMRLKEVSKGSTDEVSLVSSALRPILLPVKELGVQLPEFNQPVDPFGFRSAQLGRKTFHDFQDHGRQLRSLSSPVRYQGHLLAVAQSAKDLGPMNASMRQVDASLETLIPLAMLIAAIAGSLLVGSTMRPLRNLMEAARNLEPDLSNERLPIVGKDEFAHLAMAFNEAFDRTSEAFAAQNQVMKQLERFTGDAGHELRTPLGAIKGSVTFLLGRQKRDPETRKSLEIIDRASDRMTNLIGDLLLLARHDAGRSELIKEPLSLYTVIREASELLVKPDSISFEICIDGDLLVEADGRSLTRAFTNLIGNAFIHARSHVQVRGVDKSDVVEVTISDDGEGIAPEHMPRLGERFYRPESARSRTQGGTGLGLAIAKAIIEGHGGSIQIESTVGVGTQVRVRLDISPPKRDSPLSSPAPE